MSDFQPGAAGLNRGEKWTRSWPTNEERQRVFLSPEGAPAEIPWAADTARTVRLKMRCVALEKELAQRALDLERMTQRVVELTNALLPMNLVEVLAIREIGRKARENYDRIAADADERTDAARAAVGLPPIPAGDLEQTRYAGKHGIVCPKCNCYWQVWVNQESGRWTCHRVGCRTSTESGELPHPCELPLPPILGHKHKI